MKAMRIALPLPLVLLLPLFLGEAPHDHVALQRWTGGRRTGSPSRWSISCCRQADSSPSASISRLRAGFIQITDLDPCRARDVGKLAGQRQAAFFPGRQFLAGRDDSGLISAVRLLLIVRHQVDDDQGAGSR